MVWFETAKNECVLHTPYMSVLKFVLPAGRMSGVATHAVSGDSGYGLLAVRQAACVQMTGDHTADVVPLAPVMAMFMKNSL